MMLQALPKLLAFSQDGLLSSLLIRKVGNVLGGAIPNCVTTFSNSNIRSVHYSWPRLKEKDRKYYVSTGIPRDEGTEGERAFNIDHFVKKKELFPNEDTPNMIFDGLRFKDLPIMNIRVTKNNTIMTLSDGKGVIKLTRSCGMEGFKNARKGTNVAAQATAIHIGKSALGMGVTSVRINVRGLGPGRLASIKGLEMSGLNIVSITDSTRVSVNPPRPRKQRKL